MADSLGTTQASDTDTDSGVDPTPPQHAKDAYSDVQVVLAFETQLCDTDTDDRVNPAPPQHAETADSDVQVVLAFETQLSNWPPNIRNRQEAVEELARIDAALARIKMELMARGIHIPDDGQ